MHILVCGGAGYIGSHMAKMLAERGHQVSVLDNLSTGHLKAVQWGQLYQGDIRDRPWLDDLLDHLAPDAVMHFSARSLVGESVGKPAEYWDNNLIGTWHLLESMRQRRIERFIFSSTAAVYGNPLTATIDESHPTQPINPYGHSKLAVEMLLRDYFRAYGLRSASLRYFNAAGADPSGLIGEAHEPETHLIPNVLRSVLVPDTTNKLHVFGHDYPTADGTCVRDYVHVNDLCHAHMLALDYLDQAPAAHLFNLGNGSGFSVLEVIRSASRVVGREVPYQLEPRRPGDPPVLVADSSRARQILGWQPAYPDIAEIIASAWNWHQHARF
jgi:UDP-glucose 4-epimerase